VEAEREEKGGTGRAGRREGRERGTIDLALMSKIVLTLPRRERLWVTV
jgi:hypothetical protein